MPIRRTLKNVVKNYSDAQIKVYSDFTVAVVCVAQLSNCYILAMNVRSSGMVSLSCFTTSQLQTVRGAVTSCIALYLVHGDGWLHLDTSSYQM